MSVEVTWLDLRIWWKRHEYKMAVKEYEDTRIYLLYCASRKRSKENERVGLEKEKYRLTLAKKNG